MDTHALKCQEQVDGPRVGAGRRPETTVSQVRQEEEEKCFKGGKINQEFEKEKREKEREKRYSK